MRAFKPSFWPRVTPREGTVECTFPTAEDRLKSAGEYCPQFFARPSVRSTTPDLAPCLPDSRETAEKPRPAACALYLARYQRSAAVPHVVRCRSTRANRIGARTHDLRAAMPPPHSTSG